MKIKSQKDFWSGVMFVATGVGFAWGATNYSFGISARPGPGYFPFGLGILLALLGAFILFESLVVETDDGEPIGPWAWKPLIIITLSVAAFGLMLPRLGLVITLPILILCASLAGDEFHWKDVLINAIVLTLGSWLIFIKGLSLVIPVWPPFVTG
ncbi:MAG: tripartite tricarboxylate transporter TctB family protein [Burkholderiales bacterium]|nr:tripartite tricarboxylate transporter TctB family protein [Burkholderiales bacterium]